MEFGKVTPEELDQVNFTLPPDRPETTRLLQRSGNKNKADVYIGCAKWGRKDWVGKIYPKGTKEGDFLNHCATHFNCIELNATFYRIPRASQTSAWKAKVCSNFRFCPNITDQDKSHQTLKDAEELTWRVHLDLEKTSFPCC